MPYWGIAMYSFKKFFATIYLWLSLFACSTTALTEVVKIEFTEFDSYSIEILHLNVGDTVEWHPVNEGHNVEFIVTPNMEALPEKSDMNEFHTMIFEEPGIYIYGCTPHLNTGMMGLIVVDNNFHNIQYANEINLSPVANSVLKRLLRKAKSMSETEIYNNRPPTQ